MELTATSTLGRMIQRTQLLFAASPTFQSLAGVSTIEEAALRTSLEDPFEVSENIQQLDLPQLYVMRTTQRKEKISEGSAPHLYPTNTIIVALLKFLPSGASGGDDFLYCNETASKICDEVDGPAINGADITFDEEEVPLPSVQSIEVTPYDSRADGIEDVSDGTTDYRYYLQAYYQLELAP